MLDYLKEFAVKIGVDILYLDEMGEDGCYVPEHNIIFLRSDLSESEEINVLAHELSHASRHKSIYFDYDKIYKTRSKAENEADIESIKISLIHYLNNLYFIDETQLNYMHFMNAYRIDYSFEPVVKKLMPIYYQKTKI